MIRSLAHEVSIPLLRKEVDPDFDFYRVRAYRMEIMDAYLEREGLVPKPYMEETLRWFHQQGYRIALATASPEERAKLYLDMTEGLITRDEFTDINNSFTLKLDRLKAALTANEKKKTEKLSLNINEVPWINEFLEYRNIQKLERRVAISLLEKVIVHDKTHIEVEFRHKEEFEEILKIALAAKEVTA